MDISVDAPARDRHRQRVAAPRIADLVFAAKLFVPFWAAAATFNLWVGVAKAGYSVREELPILFIVVLIPNAPAAFAIWRVSR